MPNVEANVSPVEGSAEGVIVADASIPYIGIGLLSEPVRLEVREGRIVSISGGEQARTLDRNLAGLGDPLVYTIAEIGIGLNPKYRFCGIMLEDEGVFGSVHVGIGTNITLGGAADRLRQLRHKEPGRGPFLPGVRYQAGIASTQLLARDAATEQCLPPAASPTISNITPAGSLP